MAVKERRFGGTFPQAVEALVMQTNQRMYSVIGRVGFNRIAVAVLTVVVIFARKPLTIICTGPAK